MNFKKFINPLSLARKPSPIRILTALTNQFGSSLISLAGGNPNPSLFPFKEANVKIWNGDILYLNEEKMKVALQYSASAGIPEFIETIKIYQNHYHNKKMYINDFDKNLNLDYSFTLGSLDGATKSFEMLLKEKDAVLVENPTNPSIINALKTHNVKLLRVDADKEGLIPANIDKQIEFFRNVKEEKGLIKFLYICPHSSFPSGVSTSLSRRQQIYQKARDYDFLIIEHDPYFFTQKEKVESFLSLDNEGRVIRLDSFSYSISPGIRLGLVTGVEPFVSRITLHTMVAAMHNPTFQQIMVNELLKELKLEGFEKFCQILTNYYEIKRNLTLKAVNKHLRDFFNWDPPSVGSLSLNLKLKKPFHNISMKKIISKMKNQQNILFSASDNCYFDGSSNCGLVFNFGFCDEEDIEKGCKYLSEEIVSFLVENNFQIQINIT